MHAKRSRQRKKQYLQAVEARFAYLEHINSILMENLQKHMPLRDIQRIISEEKNPQVVAVLQSAFSFTYPCPYPSARTPQDVQAGAVSAQCPKQPTGFRHASYSPASTQDDAASPSEAAPPLKKQAVAGVKAGLNGRLLPGGMSGLGDNAPGAMSAASMMGQLTGLDAVVAASVARLATADQTNDKR